MTVDDFVTSLEDWPQSVIWMFRNGGCYQFYTYTRNFFPQARALYDGDHVLVEVEGLVFDAGGFVEVGSHVDMDPLIEERAVTWQETLPTPRQLDTVKWTQAQATKETI
jgi:hypothetical protein